MLRFKAGDLTNQQRHLLFGAKSAHFANSLRSCLEIIPAMKEGNGFGFTHQMQRPIQRGITATTNHDLLISKALGIIDMIKKLFTFKCFNALKLQGAWLKGAYSCSNKNRLT